MSDEEQENEHDVQKEKELVESLGVSSTWNVLSEPGNKKKKPEEKREFKGFKWKFHDFFQLVEIFILTSKVQEYLTLFL